MNAFRRRYLGAALFCGGALCGFSAHAAQTFTGVACNGHGTAMTSGPGYVDCSGSLSGNGPNKEAEVVSQIFSAWGLTDLTAQNVTGGNSGSSGSLTFANQSGLFVLSLKAGNAISLYEFNGAAVAGGISSITFDTLGVGFFSGPNDRNEHFGQGLSHATLYSVTAPVPEPGTYALMLAGLAVVGIAARRRKTR